MNNQIRNTIIALFLLTPFSVLLVYGKWDFLFIHFDEFLYVFNKWHWFKMSIILTSITYLSSYAITWFYVYYENPLEAGLSSMIYAISVMPIGVMLFYPGADSMIYISGSNAYALILILDIIHGFSMKIFLNNLIHLTEDKIDRKLR